jgi:hypothetical protein
LGYGEYLTLFEKNEVKFEALLLGLTVISQRRNVGVVSSRDAT